jgi:hypothetical protein
MKQATVAVLCFAAIATAAQAWAEGPFASIYDTRRSITSGYEWTFSAAAEFMTGRLGTSVTTHNVYVPFTLQRNLPRGRVAITLPYMGQHTGFDVADREGRIYQVAKTGNTSTINGGGLSDILLKGAFDYKRQMDGDPFDLSWVGKVKFPSSDTSQGLGTGETDVSVGAEAFRKLQDTNWFLMGDLYYTDVGDMPGNKLNNQWALSMGAGYQWPEAAYVSVSYEEQAALAEDRPRPRDFIFHMGKPINEDTDLVGNILWGLSEGAADFGIGIGTNIRF